MDARIAARLCTLLAAISLAATVSAQATRAEFDVIDTNDDGRVSSSEHEVYARQIFDQMDGNNDDKLTVEEIMANETKFVRHVFAGGNILGPADLTTAQKIQRIDANQDGVVSQSEHANAADAKYRAMDINNNGELSPTEFDAGG
jgi:hypothetical protein